MDAIDPRQLEEAVIVFYRSGSSEQAHAHDWLTKAQSSPHAWSFVWDLMQLDKPSEVQFFGATTLHSKLMKYWHEVPERDYEELKQKLLETIVLFGRGPKIVLNRLCIALSSFIVQMLKHWPNGIQDVVNTFLNQQLPNLDANTQIWILMEVICGIPEEANAITSSVVRVTLRNDIKKHAPFILQTLVQYLNSKCDVPLTSEDMNALLRASKCATVWLRNDGFDLDKCQYLATALLNLTNKCYWNSSQSDGCMSADENELTESCLEALSAMMIQPDAHRFSNTALGLMKLFIESLSQITKAEWCENNLNEDIAVGIYTLFISAIECHSRFLLSGVLAESIEHRQLYDALIHEILQCTDKPGIYPVEESCSVLAMGFWYMLQDEILSSDEEVEKTKCLQLISPLYSHLSRILVRKSQQPDEESLDKWSSDDLETFRCYRQDIADTLLYCQEVLHDQLLVNISEMLDDSIVSIRTDCKNWTQLEACIYAFYAIAEHIDTYERKSIPKLMKVLIEIPYEKLSEKILGTALETIGAYSEWFKDNPTYLPSAIELLVRGLDSPMASQATLGLKDLCRECQLQMKVYAEPLLQACSQALLSGRLKHSESVRLMFSIGKIMSTLPPEKMLPYLDSLVSPCFSELQAIVLGQIVNESSRIRSTYRLNMVSTLFSSLNINADAENVQNQQTMQPVLCVMQKTMPIFKDIGIMFINEPPVIDALCNSLKHAIVNLQNDFKPMLPDLCCLIIQIFQSKFVPPAIEIAKTCILLFYRDEEAKNTMLQLLVEVSNRVFKIIETTPDAYLSDITDLIETFYSFNAAIVKKIPAIYGETNINCNKLLSNAIKAMTLAEISSVKNVLTFLNHFILQSRNFPILTAAVLVKGADIVKMTLMNIGFRTPRTHIEIYGDIFIAFNKKYPAELITWMKVLEMQKFPTQIISASEKHNFTKLIIKEKVNKRLVQQYIREFAGKCRGHE